MGNPGNTRKSGSSAGGGLNPGDEAPPDAPGAGDDLCPKCKGSGRIRGSKCENCGGTGRITEGIGGA